MVCVHTYSESNNTSLRYGRLKFSKMAAGRHLEFHPTGNFPKMCEWGLRSVVDRWSSVVGRSVVNIHTSYTDLIYSSFATLGT